ncbi:MAG TPA: S-layer homology domain-containing protein [Bacillota bacterium]|nr:S-layer homology domain-containing protein [Bacillota bacterium]
MNISKIKIAYILAAVMLLNLAPVPVNAEDILASGNTTGDALIKNASFQDISGNPNAENIMKMSVYSIVREYGDRMYRPNQAASRQDVLAALIRATGRQQEAVRLAEQLRINDPSLSSVNAYMMGHVQAARNAGIITAQEAEAAGKLTPAEIEQIRAEVLEAVRADWKMTLARKNQLERQLTDRKSFQKAYGAAAKREDTALWIARALGLEPINGHDITAVYNYSDWRSIKTENLPYVEAVLKKGIMKGTTATSFSPGGNISRGEMASVMNMVADQSLDKLGYRTGYGRVTAVSLSRDIGAVADTYTTVINIETPDSEVVSINVKKSSTRSSTSQESVPVIKNKKIGDESLIAQGDIVEYTIDGENRAILLHTAELKEIDGTFVHYDPVQNTVQVGDSSNNMYLLKVMPDSVITVQKDPVDIGRLEPNSPAKVVFANDILKSLSVDAAPELVGGRETPVRIIYAQTSPVGSIIKVADEYNNMDYLDLADNAAIYINGQLRGVDAIGFDQDAVVRIFNGKVHEVKIYTDAIGEDPYRQIVLTAKVRDISDKGITLLTDDNPQTPVLYTIDRNTPIIKDKQNVSASVLRQGDRVRIEVNSASDRHIIRMEVQGLGVQIEKVYKGDIQDVIPETGEIVLSNVYTYGYYDWIKKDGNIKYRLSDGAGIYNGDTKLNPDRLRDYIGKTIYAVSKKNYGSEELVKAVLKDGAESTLYKNIYDVKWTTKQLTLSDGRLLKFSDGSIVIRDGRLLDSMYIGDYTRAFLVQNRSVLGVGSVPLISLDSFNGFNNYNITRGYLHNMGEDYYTIENPFRLENNEWVESEELTFLLSSETFIYDNVVEKGTISVEKFAESRYAPYTYTWPNYKPKSKGKDVDFHEDDEYHYDYERRRNESKFHQHILMYAVTDGEGNTHAAYLMKKDKNSFNPDIVYKERYTAGQINEIDLGNNKVTLKNARDFSEIYQEWVAVKAEVPLETRKMVILKDGQVITIDELQPDDYVYVLSDDDYAIFMIVE